MELLRAFPAIRVAAPFMLGVIAGAFLTEYVEISLTQLLFTATVWVLLSLVLLVWSFGSGRAVLFGVLATVTITLSGFILICSVSGSLYPAHFTNNELDGPAIYVMTIDGEPLPKAKSIKVEADAMRADGKSFGRVLLYLRHDSLTPSLRHGDVLLVHTDLQRVRPAGNPNEFNYARYLRFHHIWHQAFVRSDDWQMLREGPPSPRRFFISLRQSMLGIFSKAGLSGNEFAVAAALVLGYKADLEQSLVQAYAGAGATHVLAVSGLHVGIIYLVINALLSFLLALPYGERIRAMLTVVILVGYAMLTGLSPSVTRAVTMFSFVAVAKSLERRGSIYNTLAASMIGLVIYDPLIVMQVGFQLSYAAVLGIVMLQPWLLSLHSFRHPFAEKVWEITCVSIAAQVTTFPLGLLYFHQFPNLFFVSNLFVIPGATVVLVLGLVAFVAQVWDPFLAFTGLLLKWTVQAMNGLVGWIDRIPHAVAQGIDISVFETVVIYGLIGALAWTAILRESRAVHVSLLCGLVLFATQAHEFGQQQRQRSLTVYNIRNETALAVMQGTQVQFIASPELLQNAQSLLFHVRHHWWAQGVTDEHPVALTDSLLNRPFSWGGRNIIVLSRPQQGQRLTLPDSLDVAIVHSVVWNDIARIAAQMPPLVVLSSALGQRTRQELQRALPADVRVWDVGTLGAFSIQAVGADGEGRLPERM